jgi:hypothetical protein
MNLKQHAIARIGACAASILVASALAASSANAAVTSVKTSSTILDVDITAFGNHITFGPELPASGSAPPAYDVTNSLASFSTSFDTPLGALSLTTGVLADKASGDTGAEEGTASSNLASFSISLGTVVSVTATVLGSTSSVDGTPSASGSTTLADLAITLFGSAIDIPVGPPPVNDVIFSAGGVTITLNQQIHEVGGGEGVTEGIVTNAIAIEFADAPQLRGRIDIAQSTASIDVATVPELSTWAMMALGFTGLALVSRRGRGFVRIA